MTLEDRIKVSLGDLLFGNLFLQHQVEELTAKLREAETAATNAKKRKRPTRLNK